jgi:hypothetical protein
MNKLRFFVVAVLLSVSVAIAFGQDYVSFEAERNDITTRAKLRFGPFRFLPALQLKNIGYDNNVYYRQVGETPVGDYTGTLSPEIKGYVLLGRSLILAFTENPEYLHYARQTRLRTFTNSYAPKARLMLFNRLTLSGEYHFRKHLRRILSEFSGLVTDTTKGTTANVFYETPRGTSLGVTGTIDRFLYGDVILPGFEAFYSRTLNRKETTGSVELYYPVFSQSLFFVTAGATKYEFEHPSARWRDSRSVQVFAGLRFPFMGRARGRLSLGYKKFVPDEPGRKSFSGLVADTDINFLFGRFSLRFGLGRGTYFSYLENAFYYVENRLSPGISFYLTRRFRLDYDFRHGTLDYPEPFPIDDPDAGPLEIKRHDTQRMHTIGLSVFFLRKTGIQLSFNILERTSNAPGFNINRNFIGLSLTQDF